ncbi:putative glucose transporter rco-3 [Candida viswanathii]|uniref:Putative glucose transporter rco-3 n=1 Tax=Candida viswanathii TaxID=5486 RepID=A0A367YIB8_9ASCO|nr:putative glucose transporter rco-3 [Candida viswanathii]
MGLQDSKLLKKYINFDEKNAGSSSRAIMYGILATFGGFLFGYDTGTISGVMAMDYVKAHFPNNRTDFTSGESSLIVSILSVGTFCGSLGAPLFSDRIGRRWTIILSTMIVFNLGVVLQTAASEKKLLIAGRAIAGLGVGLISSVVPTFISETSPRWIRGSIVSTYQFMITIGLLVAACANKGTSNRDDSGSYRIPIGIQLAWGLLLGIGFFFAPDTPRFWISMSREDKAKESLSRLRSLPVDHQDLIDEYDEIKANFEYEAQYGNASWLQVFKNVNRQHRRLFTGCALQALQQLTGINFIFYFGTQFFTRSGIDDPFLIQLATNIVNVGATIPGIVLVETWGRRSLMMFGSVVMAVSQLIVAIVGVTKPHAHAANQTLVAFSCIFIAGFACSWGPLAWAICSENYSLNVRQKSISITTAFNWLFNFAIAYATPYLVDSGPGNADLGSKVFFIWGGCNVIGGIFIYLMIFEAKGLSLENVDEMYMKVKHAWQSKGFVPSTHAFRDETVGVHRTSSEIKDDVAHVEEDSI